MGVNMKKSMCWLLLWFEKDIFFIDFQCFVKVGKK
jgi:hypothetical protein